MSEDQTGQHEPESEDDQSATRASSHDAAPSQQNEQVSTCGAWLVIGCLGSVLLIAGVAFIGGIAYLVLTAEDDDEIAADPTPVVAEAETPHPEAPTPIPEEPVPTPDPDMPTSFGPGTHRVGEDIQPGIYFANDADEFCYWERLSDFSGETEDIITNQISDYRGIVQIQPSDAGFASERCGEWDMNAPLVRDDPTADLGAGVFLVPDEMAPGAWQSQGAGDTCYWARLSGFTSELEHIITNRFGEDDPIVEIREEDAGFESSECGTWVYLGD